MENNRQHKPGQKSMSGRQPHENYGNETRGLNVVMRWMPYEYSQPKIDFEAEVIRSLGLTGDETVVDLGCGAGLTLEDLYLRHGHRGRLIGIDPEIEQFDQLWGERTASSGEHEDFEKTVEFMEGRAQSIPLPDNSADRILAAYSMYLVPRNEQPLAMAEIKRVLRDDGIFVLATSGPGNKMFHRLHEKNVGTYLGAKPPKIMNRNYTSQRAMTHLPYYFTNVRHIPLHSRMVFRTAEELEAYYISLGTMVDQYDPIPTGTQWQDALKAVVTPVIDEQMARLGYYSDIIQRDIFVCSDN